MKTLVFRLKGEYARYRCPYTTTSALTYLTIHPIAVKGIVGGIQGIGYKELYEYTKNMKIAIQVLNQVKKDTQSINLISLKKKKEPENFPSTVEFLRNVEYRIFIHDEDSKLKEIKKTLIKRDYVFTPYLGVSEYIAKLDYEMLVDAKKIKKSREYMVDTIVPKNIVNIEELNSKDVVLDRIPLMNSKTREYVQYEKIIFSVKDKMLTNHNNIYSVGEYNVYFL